MGTGPGFSAANAAAAHREERRAGGLDGGCAGAGAGPRRQVAPTQTSDEPRLRGAQASARQPTPDPHPGTTAVSLAFFPPPTRLQAWVHSPGTAVLPLRNGERPMGAT